MVATIPQYALEQAWDAHRGDDGWLSRVKGAGSVHCMTGVVLRDAV